ncbi:hypothetical protein D1872_269770 [compost metagenome]
MLYFRSNQGTEYDIAVRKHYDLYPKWRVVYEKLSELLDEKITMLVRTKDYLQIDYSELTKDGNKKLFKKDGRLKANSKKAKEIDAEYQKIIQEAGLEEFKPLGLINFTYGVYRLEGESLKSFVTSENGIFFEASFDLEERAKNTGGNSVVPITAIEYQEKYLEELKKAESNK